MMKGFLENGFYISGIPLTYTHMHRGPRQKTGNKFKGVNQTFSTEYQFTVVAINRIIKGNTEELIDIVNRTPVRSFTFPGKSIVSPKTIYDFYNELDLVTDFDFSERYHSPSPRHIEKYLDKIAPCMYDERLSRYSSNVFKLVEVKADTASSRTRLKDWVEFSFVGGKITLKKLAVKLISQGIVQFDRDLEDD